MGGITMKDFQNESIIENTSLIIIIYFILKDMNKLNLSKWVALNHFGKILQVKLNLHTLKEQYYHWMSTMISCMNNLNIKVCEYDVHKNHGTFIRLVT